MFVGPTKWWPLFANLNWWGLVIGFISIVLQYKAASYEIEKEKATDKSKFPDTVYFKKSAL